MKLGLSIVVLLAATIAATIVIPAAGAAPLPACGDVVTQNVTLTKSLKNCASGLVVGADNVTIDLNGYTIKGLGTAAGVGIDAADHTGITLKNGKITDFAEGIKLFNVSNSTIEDIVVRRTVSRHPRRPHRQRIGFEPDSRQQGRRVGPASFSSALPSAASPATRSPICPGPASSVATPSQAMSRSIESLGPKSIRIRLFFCGASVTDNVANDNDAEGIFRTRSNGPTLRNVANDNVGTGISLDDSSGSIVENVTNRNSGHGLAIVDQNAANGPFYTVTRNTANRNFEFGIMTNLVGVIDGGGNRARLNGDPLQCQGVSCL